VRIVRRLRFFGVEIVNASISAARLLSRRERLRPPAEVEKADLMARFANEPAEPPLQPEGGSVSIRKKNA